jgi:ATP-binding cassette, subfamily B, bacterial
MTGPQTNEGGPIGPRRILQLAFKAWPFLRPLLRHLLILMASAGLITLILFAVTLLATDLFNNKILVGDKLQPMQATLLFVDDSYIADNIADNINQSELLTPNQRKVVRNHAMAWTAMIAALVIPLGALLFYYNLWIWQMINQNLRVAMIAKAEHLSLRFHSQSRVGDAIFRVYQDSATITSFLQEAFINPVVALYGVITSLAFIAFFDPLLAIVCALVVLPMIVITAWFTPLLRSRALANRVANSDLTSRLQETMVALRVVKANQGEHRILDRFDTDSHRALDAAFMMRMTIAVLTLIVVTASAATTIGLEYLIVYWVLDERETFLGAAVATVIGFAVWNFGAFEDARGRISTTLFGTTGLLGTWARLQDLFIGLERAFYLLDLEADIVDVASPKPFPSPVHSVTWENVSFAYDASLPVLKGIDLTARAGTITAVVGGSGAGKSTLMSLLLRLYDPDSGRMLINGIDLRDLAIDDIRANVAIALQRNVLFAGTVADNIGYAARNPSRADIEAAARVACGHDFISDMAAGYDTELGERGGKLSSGQRQRLSLARALVRDTPILVLDEPTASLDVETELAVMRNLGQWGRERIVFIVTHRIGTIRNADQIVFLEHGTPVETGAHGELMAAGGRYRAFVEAALGSASDE